MSEELTTFDAAEYLATEEDMASYLDAVLADGDTRLLAAALGDIARARESSGCHKHERRAESVSAAEAGVPISVAIASVSNHRKDWI